MTDPKTSNDRSDQQRSQNDPPLAQAKGLVAGLFDWEFQTIVTTRMVPTIYGLGVVLTVLFTAYLIVTAFQSSLLSGFAWLLLFGPAVLIAILVVLRISLEVILVLFRLAFLVENMEPLIHKISGQTDEIVTDLPRIQFWKSRKRD